MARNIYIGVSSKARKIKKAYVGVNTSLSPNLAQYTLNVDNNNLNDFFKVYNGIGYGTIDAGSSISSTQDGPFDWTKSFVMIPRDSNSKKYDYVYASEDNGLTWTKKNLPKNTVEYEAYNQKTYSYFANGNFNIIYFWHNGNKTTVSKDKNISFNSLGFFEEDNSLTGSMSTSWYAARNIIYAKNIWVSQTGMYSINGIDWIASPNKSSFGVVHGIVYGNNIFIAYKDGSFLYSQDGINWTSKNFPKTLQLNKSILSSMGIFFINNTFIAAVNGQYILKSVDGINWTLTQLHVGQNETEETFPGSAAKIAGFNGVYVVMDTLNPNQAHSISCYSFDGNNWMELSLPDSSTSYSCIDICVIGDSLKNNQKFYVTTDKNFYFIGTVNLATKTITWKKVINSYLASRTTSSPYTQIFYQSPHAFFYGGNTQNILYMNDKDQVLTKVYTPEDNTNGGTFDYMNMVGGSTVLEPVYGGMYERSKLILIAKKDFSNLTFKIDYKLPSTTNKKILLNGESLINESNLQESKTVSISDVKKGDMLEFLYWDTHAYSKSSSNYMKIYDMSVTTNMIDSYQTKSVARRIKKGFIGVDGKARLFYLSDPYYIGELTDLTTARVNKTMAASTANLIVAGGSTKYSSSSSYQLSTVEAYNKNLTKITSVSNLPNVVRQAGGFGVKDKAIIAGGYNNSNFNEKYFVYNSSLTLSSYGTSFLGGTQYGVTAIDYGYTFRSEYGSNSNSILQINSSLTLTRVTLYSKGRTATNIYNALVQGTFEEDADSSGTQASYEIITPSGTNIGLFSGLNFGPSGADGGSRVVDSASLENCAVFSAGMGSVKGFYVCITDSGVLTKTMCPQAGSQICKLGNGIAMFTNMNGITNKVYFLDNSHTISSLPDSSVYPGSALWGWRDSERIAFNDLAVFSPTFAGTTSSEAGTNAAQYVPSNKIFAYGF